MATPSTSAAWARPAYSIRILHRVLSCIGLASAAAFVSQIFTAFWARHELSQVESIVAIHARMLASGDGIYYDLQHYPFTVSPYGPLFYALSAALQTAGVAPLIAGRLISIFALAGALWLCYHLVWRYTADHASSVMAALLLASTANVLQWGTVGQVDTLGLCFSLAALLAYSRSELDGKWTSLVWSGVWILLAVFTKQSFLAAGATVALLALLKNRRHGVSFATGLALTGAALAFALNQFTQGRFFENAVLANLNPYSLEKLRGHLRYFLPAAGGLLFVCACGWAVRPRRDRDHGVGSWNLHPFPLYLAAAAAVMVLTAPKIGSDLNYQVETMTALCLMAGWTLHRLEFFTLWRRRDPGWITLLQLPLLLHLVLNLSLTTKSVFERNLLEQLRRQEAAILRPYFRRADQRILSVQIDPLLQNHQRMEVEPLIYTLLVNAGVVDPGPVRNDLATSRFVLVVLYEDVFALPSSARNPEIPSLPEALLEEIRRNYRLVRHVPGALLDGVYLYQPNRRPILSPRASATASAARLRLDYSQAPMTNRSIEKLESPQL